MYKTEMTEQLIYRIYKITNSIDDKIYIGSTHLKLKKRMDGHRKEARKDNKKIFNSIRAHIPYKHYRGNVEGKRKNRMDYYYRQKQKPEWLEKERQRNKKRMRIKRQLIKNNLTKNKKIFIIVDKFSKI